MKISNKLPPKHIYDKAKEKWGVDFYKGIVFTYGDTVHSIAGLPKDLVAHESVHIKQQTEYPGGPNVWWDKYFIDEQFRYSQELEAYKAQYKWVKVNIRDKNKAAKMLHWYASCLSGEMYGSLLSLSEAKKAIKND